MAVAVQEAPDALGVRETESTPRRVAYLFPGQGLPVGSLFSYYENLRRQNPILLHDRMEIAEYVTGLPLEKFLEESIVEPFEKTSVVQPVVYALSIAGMSCFRAYSRERRRRIRFDQLLVAGHSLGEYTALTVAGVIGFEDGLRIVSERGRLMQEASEQNTTGLTSTLGLSENDVESICEETNTSVALINAPVAIVVGGEVPKLEAVENLAKERGARRVTRLPTAGAFHTSYMQDAAVQLESFLERFNLDAFLFPVVMNLGGEIVGDESYVKPTLIRSMTRPVQWARVLATMKNMGIESFIEIGPGNSLAALNRLNDIPAEQTKNF